MAELGLVADGANSYQVWLGGSSRADRLAEAYAQRVKVKDIEAFFEPIFALFKQQRQAGESLGDWAARVGFDAIRQHQEAAKAEAAKAAAV